MLVGLVVVVGIPSLGWQGAMASPRMDPHTSPSWSPRIPPEIHELALRVIASANHGGLPFAIVSKHAAVVAVVAV